MNSVDKRQPQISAAGGWSGSPPGRWRIGTTSVSTEKLQAWQLGPARIDYFSAADAPPRSREVR